MVKENGQKVLVKSVELSKVIISKERRKAMENLNGQVAIFIEESIRMMKDMGMEKCTGLIKVAIKEAGSVEFNTVKE